MTIADIAGQMAEAAIRMVAAHRPTRTFYYDTQANPSLTSWVELTGTLQYEVENRQYGHIEQESGDGVQATATLECASDTTELTIDHFIKVVEGETITVWKVVAGPRGTASKIYALAQYVPDGYGTDHGEWQ